MDDLVKMMEETGLPFAYDHFEEGEAPEPPFVCYLLPQSNHFSAKSISNCIPTVRTCRQNRKWKPCWISMAFFMRNPRYGLKAKSCMKSCIHLRWRFRHGK